MRSTQFAKKMQTLLLRRHEALRKSLTGELGRLSSTEERAVGDAIDAAVDGDCCEINSQLAQAESRELERIVEALRKLRLGQYGLCEYCGGAIPTTRLQALPYATMCIQCQRLAEEGRLPEPLAHDAAHRQERGEEVANSPQVTDSLEMSV